MKPLKLILALLLLSACAFGQAARFDSVAQSTTTVSATNTTVLVPLPSASITVCSYPANGSLPCTNKASVCPDITATGCTSTSPNNPITADARGNFGFWIAPGVYAYTMCPLSGICQGPYVALVPFGVTAPNLITTPANKFILGVTPFIGTPNYTGTGANTLLQSNLGTAVTPDSTQDSVAIFSKSGNNTTASGKNPTVYAGAIKRATCNNCGETGLFAEGNDVVGGSGSYIEGLRGHGLLNGGAAGNATGIVGLAGTGTSIPYLYLNGIEGQNYNNSGTDAITTFSSAKFSAGFLASSFGTNKVDAGFMTNPFSTAPDITGFLVPAASVSDTAFRSDAALAHGVDLSRGTCSSDCFKSPGYTVDGSGNVKTAGTVQNNAGTATMGMTLKTGSGGGNYSSASTTYVRVDSTNLAFTVTIPTGWKLGIAASGSSTVLTASVPYDIALADGSADNTGILAETLLQPNAAFPTSFSLHYVVTGDGASHTINLQYHTTNAADSVQIYNSSSTQKPTMVMTLMPSN